MHAIDHISSSVIVKTIRHGITHFFQGAMQWISLPTDAKDIEYFNILM